MPISQDARRIQRASPTPIHITKSPSQQALNWQKSLIGTAVAHQLRMPKATYWEMRFPHVRSLFRKKRSAMLPY